MVILTFQTERTTGWKIKARTFIYRMNSYIVRANHVTVNSFGYCTLNDNSTSLNSGYWEEWHFCFMKMFIVAFLPNYTPTLITS